MTEQFQDFRQVSDPKVIIDGEDICELNAFMSIEFYENVNLGGVTGSIMMLDGDELDFIGTRDIEFIEEMEFSFKDAQGNELSFKGELNGLRKEIIEKQNKIYIIDFSSKSVRMNEMKHITQRIENKPPQDIVKEMVENYLDGELDAKGDAGIPMSWVPGRRKPLEVIKYAINHGMTQEAQGSEEEAKGTSGFLFWETIEGYRFCPITDLMEGELFEAHTEYNTVISQRSEELEKLCKAPIHYEFPKVGDMHNKLRSGAYNSVYVSFDTNTGKYSEVKYEADEKTTTDKQKKVAESPTRYLMRMFNNERFQNDCAKAKDATGDQSRGYLQQTVSRTNTFDNLNGRVVLPPNFNIKAGDNIEMKISKVGLSEESSNKYDEKISGKYIISQVGHHVDRDGTGFTKISVIRTVKQSHEPNSSN